MPNPSNELLQERLDHLAVKLDQKLEAILEQTTRTNGRVTKAEEQIDDLESWRDHSAGRISGVLIPLTVISPIVAGLIVSYLSH